MPDRVENWQSFYLEHRRALHAYALSLTRNLDAAQEIVQDVLVRAVATDRRPHNPLGFVLRCLRNAAIDRHRRRKGSEPFESDPGGGLFDLDRCGLEDRERAARIQQALTTLTRPQHDVLVLRIWGEMTFREVAETLERPLGTVTSEYARGLAALRNVLAPEMHHA